MKPSALLSKAGTFLLSLFIAAVPTRAAFVHPGCLTDATDIARMQTQINANAHPWIDGWHNLQSSTFASNTRVANPVADVVRGCGTVCTENYTSCMQDAATAYQNALEYVITGNTAYANCAVNIMNSWARTLTVIDTCCSDHVLLAGIQGYQFAGAGELLRNYSGWAPSDFAAYQNWMMTVWYPVNHDFLVNHNGACISHYWCNWDACTLASMISIGVLCDNQSVFNEAVSYFQTGGGNGALAHAIYNEFGPGLGQWQESGRDQGHNMLGIGLIGYVCEVAWKQGVDLYGYVTGGKTYYDGMEYVAKYNVDTNNSVPYVTLTTCDPTETQTSISINGRGVSTQRNYWDMIYTAFLRKGLNPPFTAQMAAGLRPDHGGGYGSTGASWAFDMVGFSTLTHYLTSTATTQTLPGVPTGLAAAAGDTQVFLTWTGSSGATSYTIQRGTANGGPYSPVANVSGPSYTDNLLTNGTAYYYTVLAENSAGPSTASNQASATPVAASSAPATPTGLAASPASSTQINLTWTTSSRAASYNLLRSTTSGGPYATIASHLTQPNFGDYGLTSGTTYYYVVQAVNSAGTSGNSGQASAAPQATTPPAAPTGLTATAASSTQINLAWSASSGATSYNVLRSATTGGPYTSVASGIATTTYSDAALSANTTYYYVVQAVNGAGASGNSNEASATTALAAPTGLTASAVSSSQINLAWTASSGATTYNVLRSATTGGPYTTVASGVATTSYSNTGLSSGMTYYYVVQAVNASSTSANSNEASATTQAVAPAAPTGLTATATSSSQINLSWTASTGATSYSVLRATTTGGPYTGIASGVASTTYSDTGLAANTTYYYVVQAVNSGGASGNSNQASATTSAAQAWTDADIGSVGIAGSGSVTNGVATVKGAGSDIGGSADSLNFLSETMTGDGIITARLASETIGGNVNDKVGLMIRESTASGSKQVVVLLDSGLSESRLAYRSTTGGSTTWTGAISGTSLPRWYRLQRSSNTFTGYVSTDGTTWTTVGSATVTMNSSLIVGFAVCSRDTTALNTSTFDNITAP